MKLQQWIVIVTVVALGLVVGGFAYAAELVTEEEAIALVEKAGKLIQEKGEAALAEISKPDGEFFIKAKDLYAFVYNEEVIVIAHPNDPTLIGQSLKGKPDVKGKNFRDEIVAQALKDGSGWTTYTYRKPGQDGDFQKKTFGKLFEAQGKKYVVCAGVYLD